MTVTLYQNDIPADLNLGKVVAIDTESMGLRPVRDRLCLVQLSSGDGHAHLVQFADGKFDAPNLKKMLADQSITKLLHFARADIGMIWMYLGVLMSPVYCTKIAARMARTYSDRHGLKVLCEELLGVQLNKEMTTTDWGAKTLTQAQIDYAADDVLYLHKLRDILDKQLVREGRADLAQSCFNFLPTRALLDVAGWEDTDIFAH
jgi:ribonuclease D